MTVFIVQNKLIFYFGSANRQFNKWYSRALTVKGSGNGTTIGMTEGQLIVALIISVYYILMDVMFI
ncbi:hypothetical protein A4H97_25970 [Niastella yeongjuensis]|uniref:Uncharacterized protein n=1 Tax=Niastella yeongjuensis TaxID=354355 RepID=A0A1V9F101_9BACT|nr:hypothetical protein A4H97_25970 [Niastella yeongjuensis]